MPLNKLTAVQARRNIRSSLDAIWPDARRKSSRMGFYASCSVTPSFTLSADDLIFTSGSCFARNIERQLRRYGYQLAVPDDPVIGKSLINKYVSRSVLDELKWGLGIAEFPVKSLLELEDGSWHDPHLHPTVQPRGSFEEVLKRREAINQLVRRIPKCRVFVLTLGLVETWVDNETGCWLNGMPPTSMLSKFPDRFSFVRQSYRNVIEDLENIHALLKEHGHPDFKMIITVSPVAFKATHTGQDAVAANTYSKSVLRAAAEEFCQVHPNVDYFPSFEMVTLSDRAVAYTPDNIHVQDEMVSRVMRFFMQNYADQKKPIEYRMREGETDRKLSMSGFYLAAKRAFEDGNHMVSARILQQIESNPDFDASDIDKSAFYFELGQAMAHCGEANQITRRTAITYFNQAIKLNESADLRSKIAQTLKELGFPESASFEMDSA